MPIVCIYLKRQCYGGPEEGGWYYEAGHPAEELAEHIRGFKTDEEANVYARELEQTVVAEANKGRRPISSVISTGIYEAIITDGLPMPFPSTRPTYE